MRAAVVISVLLPLAACAPEKTRSTCGAPEEICLLAGTGEQAFDGDGKAATKTSFYLPTAARTDASGRVLIMDFNNMRLRRLADDGTIETLAGTGEHLGAEIGVDARDSPLENPIDFAIGPDGDIFIVSLHDARVLRIDADGVMQVFAGSLESATPGDGGPALEAGFVELTGIALAQDGNVYVADGGAFRVRVIHPDGMIETLAGGIEQGYTGDGGPARAAFLVRPEGLALDRDGAVYIADSGAHVVRHVDAAGTIETVVGTGRAGFSGDGGPAQEAQLQSPEGVFVDVEGDGSLYVADTGNHRIRRVDRDGAITTIAGTGEPGHSGDDGPALEAQLNGPSRPSITGDRLYVPDTRNALIRVVHLPRADGPER